MPSLPDLIARRLHTEARIRHYLDMAADAKARHDVRAFDSAMRGHARARRAAMLLEKRGAALQLPLPLESEGTRNVRP